VALEPGTRFGSYEVIEPIGSGGMGDVYRATDTKLKRDVAVKVLPESFAADADRLARFQREAEVLASLNHPNIATIHGLERVDGQTVIVMELVEGTTLADRLERGPIPSDEALGIAFQVAAALEAAHEQQIVHRDLKPANIKLRPDGTVKVLDFGISKPLAAHAVSGGSPVMTTPAVTQTGVILGTAAYMSPEQARGKSVDERTDIWAFGCLLFEMLTGQAAFGGEDVMLTLARVLDRDTDLSSMPAAIAPAVGQTIKLCLEKDPRRRIADIRDVRLALDGAFVPAPKRIGRDAVSRPLWRRVGPFAVVAVAAGAISIAAVNLWDTPLPRQPAEVRRSIFTIPTNRRSVGNLPSVILAVSPDGSEFTFGGDDGLYRHRLSELDTRLIRGSGSRQPYDPHYSPDGRNILYATAGNGTGAGALWNVAVDGGTPRQIRDRSPDTGWQWPDDDTIYYADYLNDGCTVWRDSAGGGDPEAVLSVPGLACVEPTTLPGGRYLIFDEHPRSALEQAQIVVYDLVSKTTTPLFPGKQPQFVEAGYLVYYDYALGIVARAFDPATLRYGDGFGFVDDVLENPGRIPQFRVSPSGTLIYLRGSQHLTGGTQLAIVDEHGSVSQALDLPRADYSSPSLSPDGSRLAVVIRDDNGSSDIYVYDLNNGSEIRPLTSSGDAIAPAWSLDGEWIAYASADPARYGVYRRRADGSGREEQIVHPEAGRRAGLPAYAPDGRLSFVRARADASPEIRIVSLPDGEPEPLVDGSGVIGPAYSPDGHAMAYGVQDAAASRIWLEPFPPDGRRFPVSGTEEVGVFPFWYGDSTLAYQTQAGIVAVDVDTGTLELTNRRSLPYLAGRLNNQNGPRAGGRRGTDDLVIALAELPQSESLLPDALEVVIIENWIEEVKARVPLLE
jgi:serine/threonine protein kinase/Tol biopolymer transport system component